MSKKQLTAKQQEVLDYIKSEIISRGFPPAVREICEAVHLKSTSSVHAHLETLERNGYIRRDPTKPRAIEILDDEFLGGRREVISIPLVGQVAAGYPILAEQNIEGYFPFPPELVPHGNCFLLKVKGESMIGIGILDGDYVLVEEKQDVHNGDVIVALIEDSATVKTFYRENGYIRLQPENDTMDPIIVQGEMSVIGQVIGGFRFFR